MNLPSDSWDQSRALDAVGGDDEFLNELAAIFSAACPALLKSLEDSVAAKNCLSAADTARLVVEKMARRNDLDDIGNACYVLHQEAGRLLDALDDFIRGRSGLPGTPGPRKT